MSIVAENKEKRYVSDNARLMAEWNWDRNTDFDPSQLTLGSNKKVWWKCGKGHEWQAIIANRNKGRGCPYCTGKMVIKGYNDLQTVNSTLAKEWNYEKNNGLTPEAVLPNSGKKVWWRCSKGHEWQATIGHRNQGKGCPYCAHRSVIKGENDLQTVNPNLAIEWNYDKNNGLTPEDVLPNSNRKVWWKCSKGHEWEASIDNRSKGRGCPFCSGNKVLKGENDLQTVNPTLAKEWNYDKNGDLKPEHFTANSGEKVWWKCDKGHEWQATIVNRNNGVSCPYCSGRFAVKGKTDLQTVNPTLAKEWNYEKNNGLTPEDVLQNSNKKVWWKCSKGHEWEASIANRTRGKGCPICNSERNTSFPEYAIVYYLEKSGLEVIHSYRGQGYELDIYIPSKKIGIEYDGYYWHKNKTKKDLEKNQKCKRVGIKLYRIREELSPLNDSSIDYIVQKNQKDLPKILEEVLSEIIGDRIDVNLKEDAIDIENLREYTEKENSILFSNPELSHEWNYERNGSLKPEHCTSNSGKQVWWKCSKGHEWQAAINNRTKGRGCPYCSGKKVLIGYNDLKTANPVLATEWNYEKNNGLTPEEVTPNSSKKVWWKCSKGHEWQSRISHRNNDSGCPYCSGQKVLKGYNDLQTVNPILAKEWNYEENGDLKPEQFTANSGKKVWWKCAKGHEWEAVIYTRNKGSGCPQCAREKRKIEKQGG